jgi:hypothetical protein
MMFYPFVNVWLTLAFIGINATLFEGWTAPSISMMTNTSPVGKAPVTGLFIACFGFA